MTNGTSGMQTAGTGLALGVALGLIVGMMIDQLGLGIALGAAFGLAFGAIAEHPRKQSENNGVLEE